MLGRFFALGALGSAVFVAGCGSGFTDAAGTSGGNDASVGDTGVMADACVPQTCPDLHYSCGKADDGCGGTIDCGSCKAVGFACSTEHSCVCVPTTCALLGFDCGTVPDGCGGLLSCGTCTGAGISCGAMSMPNKCGAGLCVPMTCAGQHVACGPVSDGCGNTLQCGDCPGVQSCGGGGVAGQCGCTGMTCAQLGYSCGMPDDGCGNTLQCGVCASPDTCNGDAMSHTCSCSTDSTCASHGYNCGDFFDPCNVEETCGPAPSEPLSVNGCTTDATHPHYYSCCPNGAIPLGGGAQDGGGTCTASGSAEPLPGNDCVALGSSGGPINAWCCAN